MFYGVIYSRIYNSRNWPCQCTTLM